MTDPGETVVVDLGLPKTKHQLLDLMGEVFQFGGPDGNFKCDPMKPGKGWGKNWDALADSLCYLDSGGIWSTGRRFKFPLRIEFINSAVYRAADRSGFTRLSSIMRCTGPCYQDNGLHFEYAFA
jgi:hypothetical protein